MSQQKKKSLLNPIQQGELNRWQLVTMDFIVHLPKSTQGHDAIMTIVDKLTKMAYFIPFNTTDDAEQVAKIYFHQIFKYHGLPKKIISDRDPKFISHFWKTL